MFLDLKLTFVDGRTDRNEPNAQPRFLLCMCEVILGISCDEAERKRSVALKSQAHHWSLCFLQSILQRFSLCPFSPPTLPSNSRMYTFFLLVKFPKSRLTAPVNSFIPHFSCLWNHLPETVLSHPSLQDLSHPQFCPMIFITPLTFINPTILLLLCFLPSSLSSFPVRSFP